MLTRNNRLDVGGLENFLASIVKELVEDQDKIEVTHRETPAKFIFTISVAEDDLPVLETQSITFRSLNHLIKKATAANLEAAPAARVRSRDPGSAMTRLRQCAALRCEAWPPDRRSFSIRAISAAATSLTSI